MAFASVSQFHVYLSNDCETDGSSTTLHQANFAAFKFAGSSVVQFRAMVTPCVPRCEPVTCSGDTEGDSSNSPRRIRRSSRQDTNLTRVEATEEEEGRVVVANILTIVERPEDKARPAPAPLHPRPQSLVTLAAVCVVFSLLLIAQCAVILLCARHRRVESSNTKL